MYYGFCLPSRLNNILDRNKTQLSSTRRRARSKTIIPVCCCHQHNLSSTVRII